MCQLSHTDPVPRADAKSPQIPERRTPTLQKTKDKQHTGRLGGRAPLSPPEPRLFTVGGEAECAGAVNVGTSAKSKKTRQTESGFSYGLLHAEHSQREASTIVKGHHLGGDLHNGLAHGG